MKLNWQKVCLLWNTVNSTFEYDFDDDGFGVKVRVCSKDF